jgi:ketosteroid isomerase-like protein
MAVEPSVQALWDIEQIKQLKARYFRLLDEQDWPAFMDLFTDDCRHFLPDGASVDWVDNGAYLDTLMTTLVPGVTTHHGHMPEITLLSDTEAEGIWSLFDYVTTTPASGRISFQGYARYYETYRKGPDGQWRISAKRNVRQRIDPR